MAKDYELLAEQTVELEPTTNSSTKDGIAKDANVNESFRMVLEDIKQQILQIPIQDQLKRAKIVSFQLSPEERAEMRRQRQERLALMAAGDEETGAVDVTNEEPPLQESFVNSLVMSILNEIKK